jgi:hypothetical protein
MENKKISQEELEQIQKLSQSYQQTIFDIGTLERDIMVMEKQISSYQETKKILLSDLNKLSEKEQEIMKSLQDKYGEGNLSLETGEITPV